MILYLDTSSLVKIYVAEEGSAKVTEMVARADLVCTSVVAFPETRSAFSRLAREGVFTNSDLTSIRTAFLRDWESFLRVRALQRICLRAGDLAEEYALRGFDALHLASYLDVLEQARDEAVEFSAFDSRLNRAAEIAARGAS